METRYSDIAKNYTGKLNGYTAFPKASDRDAYTKLPDKLKDEIISEGEKYLHCHYPSIKATDYMAFVRTGDRISFEKIYFEKRHALCALTLAECVEYSGRFIDDIINGIFSLCEESGWQLPAHNTYIRDTPQHILPDYDMPIIDLFAAETGALLAWVSYLLGNSLTLISPVIITRIASEINRRIIVPYTASHFWWMGNGDEKMCNWTAWCTQNVLLSAFLLNDDDNKANPIDDATIKKIFIQASESCDCFIKDYGNDGCCDEGAGYYRHAGLCLFGALDILNFISNGAFYDVFSDKKLNNIASYILNVHIADEYYFNFADCSATPGRCGVREYLFGKSVGNANLCDLAAADFRVSGGKLYTGDTDQINLFYILMTCFNYVEVYAYNPATALQKNSSSEETLPDNTLSEKNLPVNNSSKTTLPKDIFYKSAGLFIARSSGLSLAVKAGHNDDNHNHNDTGSFILYKNGIPVFADIGVENYTKKTFSPDRYEIWTMQSCYHNLPTISGIDQKDGKQYRATDVSTHLSDSEACISMELITAYPIDHGSYKRTVVLDKINETVTLTDVTDCNDAVLNFILYETPVIENNMISIGNHTKCYFDGADVIGIETLKITDSRLLKAWHHDLYRLRLKINKSPSVKRSFSMKIM